MSRPFPQQDVAQERRKRSILTRKRFQFVGALAVAVLLPWVGRTFFSGTLFAAAATNALFANTVAVAIALWMRLSFETYPGVRRSYFILPSASTAHGIVIVWFLLTRFPYDRVALAAGYVLHVVWLYWIYIYAERRFATRIAVVPFGTVDRLFEIKEVQWLPLKRPQLRDTRGCDAIVADFSADLPDKWEAFLADAALAGSIVYQHKQLSESLTGRVELEQLSENSFGSLVPSRGYFHLKSMIDFLCALILLPFLLPIMAVAALMVLVDDGSPVLFRQQRLGHRGRIFTAYKFRTMKTVELSNDQDKVRKALATDDDDPRITKVGAILRRYRIDELPQIFNILMNQMSWIGPRPEPEILTRWFLAEIPFYRYRHVVKPGISGWAQVNQGYVSGVKGINVKLQYDFYYIKYFSPWLDLLVFFRTVKTMLTGFGSR